MNSEAWKQFEENVIDRIDILFQRVEALEEQVKALERVTNVLAGSKLAEIDAECARIHEESQREATREG